MPVRAETDGAEPPARRDFWDKYGWQTTLSISVGIGAFGLLQFLIGVVVVPIHPVIDVFALFVLFLTAPLLVVAGLTGFLMPVGSMIRHHFLD